MNHFNKRFVLSGVLLLGLPLMCIPSVYAAKPINLNHQSPTLLTTLIAGPLTGIDVSEISRSVTKAKMTHIRIQQTYEGYQVWGADAVIHLPQTSRSLSTARFQSLLNTPEASMNGTVYQGIDKDLANTRQSELSNAQGDKALNRAIQTYTQTLGSKPSISNQTISRIVFIDQDNKAHWAFLVGFDAKAVKEGELPAMPHYILDATSLQILAQWDDIKTAGGKKVLEKVAGGGFGGNIKMGKLSYDGLEGDLHYAKLAISRDVETNTCSLQNPDVVVKHSRRMKVMSFKCEAADADHEGLFWNADFDAINDGYSPGNDALFGGIVIKNMYSDWYGVPVLTDDQGQPLLLTMVVHEKMENAYWDGSKMTFGDGGSMFYPLTSLGVAAHEISHGFTQQHSNLAYYSYSGGMNEAYSDMAAQAAELYAYGKNSWQIGPEIFKAENEALRYLDTPSKDCGKKKPGNRCSIDNADQYYSGLDVHYSSGVFNRAFYLMGTAEGWDAKKAFDVMVNANSHYWTKTSTFVEGACGVLASAKELGYDIKPIQVAFETVKVDISDC
jgi:pseudolysin